MLGKVWGGWKRWRTRWTFVSKRTKRPYNVCLPLFTSDVGSGQSACRYCAATVPRLHGRPAATKRRSTIAIAISEDAHLRDTTHFPMNGAHIVTFSDPQHRPLIANDSSSHLLLLPTTRRPPGSRVFAYVELYLWGERRGIEICFELLPVRREQDGEFEYQQVSERIVWGPCGSTKAKTFATTRSTMPSTPEGSAAFTGLFPSLHSILGSP